MAYSDPYTFVPLQPLLASQLNTLSVNIRALWPYVSGGEMAYSIDGTTLAKLSKPLAGAMLMHNATIPSWLARPASLALLQNNGTTPAWVLAGVPGQFLRVNSAGTGFEFSAGQATRVYPSASVNVSSLSPIPWNSEAFDDGGWHSTVTNTSRITPGVAGRYRATLYISTVGITSSFYFRMNGTTTVARDRSPGAEILMSAGPIVMSATDYIEAVVEEDGGAVTQIYNASFFALERI